MPEAKTLLRLYLYTMRRKTSETKNRSLRILNCTVKAGLTA